MAGKKSIIKKRSTRVKKSISKKPRKSRKSRKSKMSLNTLNTLNIKRDQQYTIDDLKLFKVSQGNTTYRDLYVDLSKNGKAGLMQLASILQINNRHKMKKDELMSIICQSISFE